MKKNLFWKYWVPVFGWAGLIFYLSHIPGEELPQWDVPYLDKVVHALEFGILAALLMRAWQMSFPKQSFLFSFTLCFLIVFFYALTDEWHQQWIAGRISSLYDLFADAIGILLFLLLSKKGSNSLAE